MISVCCLLIVIVWKKVKIIRSAIAIKKMKLARVSKPRKSETFAMDSGNIAINKKTIGRSSQAIELLTDMEFLRTEKMIKINRMIVAIVISIWILVIFFPSYA